jgi:hypothetical protein
LHVLGRINPSLKPNFKTNIEETGGIVESSVRRPMASRSNTAGIGLLRRQNIASRTAVRPFLTALSRIVLEQILSAPAPLARRADTTHQRFLE